MIRDYIELLTCIVEIKNNPKTPAKYKSELIKHEYFLRGVIEKGENPKSNKNRNLFEQLISLILKYYNPD